MMMKIHKNASPIKLQTTASYGQRHLTNLYDVPHVL